MSKFEAVVKEARKKLLATFLRSVALVTLLAVGTCIFVSVAGIHDKTILLVLGAVNGFLVYAMYMIPENRKIFNESQEKLKKIILEDLEELKRKKNET